jgi:hypothetical protein
MVTNELRPAVGGDCPSVAPTELDNGSTMMEGTLCSLMVSSPAASPTLRFKCLGFEELLEKKKGEFNKTQQLQIEQKYSQV